MQTIEQAIETAIKYENRVRDVYKDAVCKTNDEIGQRVFGVLAKEEQGHVDYLEHMLSKVRAGEAVVPGELTSALPTKAAIEAGVKKLTKQLQSTCLDAEVELLRKALHVEEETSAFYRKVVGDLPPEGQALFSPFIAIEDGHVAIVQAEIDSITGMGFWFDYQEFDFEMG